MEHPRGEGDEPPPQNDNGWQLHKEWNETSNQNEDNVDLNFQLTKQDKTPLEIYLETCKPIASKHPKVELLGHQINVKIKYMKDHALIGKFIKLWLTNKVLGSRINAKWNPKGHMTL